VCAINADTAHSLSSAALSVPVALQLAKGHCAVFEMCGFQVGEGERDGLVGMVALAELLVQVSCAVCTYLAKRAAKE